MMASILFTNARVFDGSSEHCTEDIKITASGGVVSPADLIWMNQYRKDEIRSIVNEQVAASGCETSCSHDQ